MNGVKNADMKSWMSSAFGSDPTLDTAKKPARTRAAVATSSKKAVNTMPTKFMLPDKKQVAGRFLLAEKYEPKMRSDLIVNKAKIEQLSTMLDWAIGQQTGSILIIEGPPGCGKQATLNILCREKNIELVQWNQPNTVLRAFDNNNDMQYTDDAEGWRDNPVGESQQKMFNNFLFKSSRYVSDQIFASEAQIRPNKILFLKDIPLFAFRDVKSFHQLLVKFKTYSKASLIFSISNSPNSSNELNPAKIFKPEYRKEIGIQEICFNPIATSFVLKHLERIVKSEANHFNVDKNFLNEVCLISDGDLRQALNILELSQHNPKVPSLTRTEPVKRTTASSKSTKTSKQKHTTRTDPSDNCLIQKKDANFSIFRGLGKVLHRKNMESSVENEKYFETERNLSKRFMKQQAYREPLFYDPDDILAKTPINEELITLYLHQNYIELYAMRSGNKTFEERFDALNAINENFMAADMMNYTLNRADISSGSHGSRHKEVTALLSIRSVLYHTYVSDSQKSSSAGKSLWMPLHKPYIYKMQELSRKKKQAVTNMLLDNTEPQNLQLACYLIEMQDEFFTSILPYASMKKNRQFKELAGETRLGQAQFKQGAGVRSMLAANENDPSFFMEDCENQSGAVKNRTAAVSTSHNLYKYEEMDDLDICDGI